MKYLMWFPDSLAGTIQDILQTLQDARTGKYWGKIKDKLPDVAKLLLTRKKLIMFLKTRQLIQFFPEEER